ncbi:MAG: hypothetical protein HFG67_03610 [Firmicutes bacterium]|nr:hypothetical protein [Bacillota bacterium]
MITFRKYYNLLFVPAVLVIFFTLFSGFAGHNENEEIKYILKERTRILQDCYYGLIDEEKAESELSAIETYPILSEDIKGLREWEGTEVDIVEKMIFTSLEKKHSILGSDTYETEICWEVSGLGEDYTMTSRYYIVIKKDNDKLVLSNFTPID